MSQILTTHCKHLNIKYLQTILYRSLDLYDIILLQLNSQHITILVFLKGTGLCIIIIFLNVLNNFQIII